VREAKQGDEVSSGYITNCGKPFHSPHYQQLFQAVKGPIQSSTFLETLPNPLKPKLISP